MSRRRYRGEGSFSKNGYGGTAQDEVGRTIFTRVDSLLESRWKLLCPFPVQDPVRELWHYALTPDQRVAWNLLSKDKRFNEAVKRISYFDIRNDEARYCIRVFSNVGVPEWPLDYKNLPTDLWQKVHYWQVQSRSYRDEHVEIREKVRALVRLCATAGQIERVWPELMGFMPTDTLNQRFDKKARSPYPDGALKYNNDTCVYELQDCWRRETLQWYDDAIAESLILPEYEHPNGAAAYPLIFDMT